MTDDKGKSRVNGCIHRRHNYDITENEDILFGDTHGGRTCSVAYSPAYYWVDWNKSIYNAELAWNVSSDTTVPPNWTITALTAEEERDLKTRLLERARELTADALLNIVEGHQLLPSVRSLATCIPQMRSNWRDLRKVIRTASGAYLAWKFGVSPILSDIMSTIRNAPKLVAAINTKRITQPRRYSVNRELKYAFGTPLSWDITPLINYSRQGLLLQAPEVRYVLVAEPNTAYGTGIFQALDAVMTRFTTSPARLAWERVPYSFIADWLVDVRGLLDAIDRTMGVTPFKIKAFSRSFTYGFRTDRFTTLKSPCAGNPILDSWRAATAEYRHYERSAVADTQQLLRIKPRIGKTQLGLLSALIAQKLSHR
jgi:hypothetical protein